MSGDFEKEMLVRTGCLIEKSDHIEKSVADLVTRVTALENRRGTWVDWFLKTGIGTVIGGLLMAAITKITQH